jgi:hypothetical protein
MVRPPELLATSSTRPHRWRRPRASHRQRTHAGVAYFTFGKNEYFIATNNNMETTVSSHDVIVELMASPISTTPLTLAAW